MTDNDFKFIGTECKRCSKGKDELYNVIAQMDVLEVNSYNEKYYN